MRIVVAGGTGFIAAVLRAVLGEGAGAILTGQRVVLRTALDLGYRFRFADIAAALSDVR